MTITTTAVPATVAEPLIAERLSNARTAVMEGMTSIARRLGSNQLANLVLDYPMRPAKALRPALMFAAAECFGVPADAVLPTAVALELYHNAFLIHDDVEDGSTRRRKSPTLHDVQGIPIAVNVGDSMLALALQPLLDNTAVLGLGPALRILRLFASMSRLTVAGQAEELGWIKDNRWPRRRWEYVRMALRKTAFYSFVTPIVAGAIMGRADAAIRGRLARAAARLGIAFQIADDILSIVGNPQSFGKDVNGDLYECKRTLILLTMLQEVSPAERVRALSALSAPVPKDATPRAITLCEGQLGASCRLRQARHTLDQRAEERVAWLRSLIERTDAIARSREYAARLIARAQRDLATVLPHEGEAAAFLLEIGPFSIERST